MRWLAFLALVAVVVASAVAAGAVEGPAPEVTPGAARPEITEAQVCASGGLTRPAIPRTVAGKVFKRYAVPKRQRSKYVLVYLVPFQLGGDTQVRNLWPVRLVDGSRATAGVADVVTQVCAHAVGLAEAQSWYTPVDWQSAASRAELARVQHAPTTTLPPQPLTNRLTVAGTCVRYANEGEVADTAVECSAPHDGRIVARVDDRSACPPETDALFESHSTPVITVCIDEDG